MKKLALALGLVMIVALGGYLFTMHTATGQDFLLSRAISVAAATPANANDGIRVFVCGSAAPLPTEGREQGCLAVLTPSHFFIVDAGSGSGNNIQLEGLPVQRLNGVLLTHFHSDHIAAIPDINLGSWASGRRDPLRVYGPPGVERVAAGFNDAFAHDREYRSAHHGEDFMPKAWGMLESIDVPVESALEFGDLKITSFAVDHSPVDPAVGYRFDYRGRSVVISGDTLITDRLRDMVDDADLLFSDALSLPLLQTMREAARSRGQERVAKILLDIQDYHASVADVAELTATTNVDMTAIYHLVPGPRNALMENIFKREFRGNMVLTRDRMWFELPAGSSEIRVD